MTEEPQDPEPVGDPVEQLRAELQRLREDHDLLAALTVPRHLTADPLLPSDPGSDDTSHEQTVATPPQPAPPRSRRAWRTMTADDAAAAWNTLVGFVDWLIDRYGLADTVPPCWFRHGAIVEELHALCLAWTGAYLHPQARPFDPATWHDLLHRTLARVREWDRYGCTSGRHRDDPPELHDDDRVAEMRAEFIAVDVADRRDADSRL